ncbi:MarR family transcriptional regulator [Microbacterium sp. Se63.02b]|uniref:MarR family winged helix-turn-helix transcriptional regulator n=1 Tax=Microbacterium sp. Se63.02b TaxID=2709304 RepID=UPI001FCEE4DE|nr:MarR family transcriptional regulator [Microbacterium sp. Se63.02b]
MTAEQHRRRLDDTEMATWLPVIRFVQLLPQVLDRTLKDEVGLNHARYAILVTLAGQGEGAVTMTELARIAGLSRSRLSHALDSLEERGWVERTSCGTDKRTLSAALTRKAGRCCAPPHPCTSNRCGNWCSIRSARRSGSSSRRSSANCCQE